MQPQPLPVIRERIHEQSYCEPRNAFSLCGCEPERSYDAIEEARGDGGRRSVPGQARPDHQHEARAGADWRKIDWAWIDGQIAPLYSDKARPGIESRFVVGLLLLKHMFAEERRIAVGTILRRAGLTDDNYLDKAAEPKRTMATPKAPRNASQRRAWHRGHAERKHSPLCGRDPRRRRGLAFAHCRRVDGQRAQGGYVSDSAAGRLQGRRRGKQSSQG
jgi:hypothetical protein